MGPGKKYCRGGDARPATGFLRDEFGASTYTSQDRATVRSNLNSVIEQYPKILKQQNSLYHAEFTILFRMSEAFGGPSPVAPFE